MHTKVTLSIISNDDAYDANCNNDSTDETWN